MSSIKLFESKQIRSSWNETEQKWYFVVEDVILVLTDSKDPKQYIKHMRQRDEELAKGWVQFVPTLWVETAGGKQRPHLVLVCKEDVLELRLQRTSYIFTFDLMS